MPVGDGPAIDATPPPGAPVRPADAGSIKETVVMNPSAMGDAADSSVPTPEYDEALGAWVVDDPAASAHCAVVIKAGTKCLILF